MFNIPFPTSGTGVYENEVGELGTSAAAVDSVAYQGVTYFII